MNELDSQRKLVKRGREELQIEEEALKAKYDNHAQEICPFGIGDEIEYELGKKGEINRIFFPSECWMPIEEQEPDHWAVTGQKINKNGKYGKKDFPAVSEKTHVIDGNVCRRKTLDETLGI